MPATLPSSPFYTPSNSPCSSALALERIERISFVGPSQALEKRDYPFDLARHRNGVWGHEPQMREKASIISLLEHNVI